VLCRLVDKSLVVALPGEGGSCRYRLLETIQQYGATKLAEAGGEPEARRRHRDAFIARAEGWGGTHLSTERLRGVSADFQNFRVALSWSWSERDAEAILRLLHTHWVPWYWSGSLEGRDWVERVFTEPEFAVPRLADHPGQIDALVARVALLAGKSSPQQAAERGEQAAALAARIGDSHRLAMVEQTRGEAALLFGDVAEGRRLLEVSLAAWERLGVLDGVGWCHNHLGWAAVAEADHERARRHFEHAVDLSRRDPLGTWLAPHALAGLATLVARAGEHERAMTMAGAAITAAQALDARPVLAMALARAAETAVLAGRASQAVARLTDLMSLLAESGTSRWLGEALEMAALVLADGGEAAQASEILGGAQALRQADGQTHRGVTAGEVHDLPPRLLRALGDAAFAHCQALGQALPEEATIARALACLNAITADTASRPC
jgi:tetratricopeptide (TPR) repeat protein